MNDPKHNENCEHYAYNRFLRNGCALLDSDCNADPSWCPLYIETKSICPVCLHGASEQVPLKHKGGTYYCTHPDCTVKTFTDLDLAEAFTETAVDFFFRASKTEREAEEERDMREALKAIGKAMASVKGVVA